MSINRITSGLLNQQSNHFLNNNLSILSNIQNRLSSGKNINNPSDDPVGLTRILALSNTLRTDDRYARNIQDAVAEVNTTDKVLSNMVDLIHRAQELTTQAANVTNNQDGRTAIGLEIDQIIDQLIQLGNTDIAGKYIFGGFVTDSPPFSRAGDNITYSGTPSTQPWERTVEISRGVTLNVNVNGDELFGDVVVFFPPPPPIPANFQAPAGPTSGNLFRTLIRLKHALDPAVGGGAANQITEIRDSLDRLTLDMNNVASKQAVVGAVSNRLELTEGRIAERESILTNQYAKIQDINMPETIANLNHQQTVFEASLGVTARLLQTTLLNFLR